jgi:tetratricopeptide (TPR) repeat protein
LRSLQIPNRLALLAQHCLRSEQWAKAFVFGLAAGRDALRRSQHREAVGLLENAAHALDRFPRSGRNYARAAQVRLDLANALFPLGRRDDAERHLESAQGAARRSKDARILTRTWSSLALHHWVAGNLEKAHRIGLRALKTAEEKNFADLRLVSMVRLGSIAMERGKGRLARTYLEKALELSTQVGGRTDGFLVVAPVACQGTAAEAMAQLGLYREAIELADAAVTTAEQSGHLFSQVYALLSAGNVYLHQGDFDRSAHLLGQSLRLCRTIGSTLLVRQIVSAMGYALLHTGRADEGCALLEDAVASATPDPMVGQLPQHLGWLAMAKLALGKHAEASVVARRAISLARRNGQRGYEAWGWYALSRAQHAGDVRTAARSLERARSIAVGCGLRPLAARTEGGWGASESGVEAAVAPTPKPAMRDRSHLRLIGKPESAPVQRAKRPLPVT